MRPAQANCIRLALTLPGRTPLTYKGNRAIEQFYHISKHQAPHLRPPPVLIALLQSRYLSSSKMSATVNAHLFKDEAEKEAALGTIVGWSKISEKDAIKKTYNFKNFVQAFSFMTAVAIESGKLDHHPEWFNVYNRVEITLNSHFCNGISKLDIKLAKIVDAIYEKAGKD